MRSFVENSGDASVGLLASRVPNLKLYSMIVFDFHNVVSEFDSYCHIMVFVEGVLDESHQDRRLADAYKKLKQTRGTYDYLR